MQTQIFTQPDPHKIVKSTRNLWLLASTAPLLLGPLWLLGLSEIVQTDFFLWKNASTAVLLAACFAAAIDDAKRMKISNWITYPTFLWLVALSVFCSLFPAYRNGIGSVGFGEMLLGVVCCFAITLIPYICGAGGAGDAKLAAVIGAGLGMQYGLIAVGTAFVIAGLVVLGRTMLVKGPFFVVRAMFRRLGSLFTFRVLLPSEEERQFLRQPLPMGPSFFFGVLFTLNGWIPFWIL